MLKRGQLTSLFIIGIALLLAFFVAAQLLKTKIPSLTSNSPPLEVKSFIGTCLQITAEDAVEQVMLQGGYYYIPEPGIQFSNIQIPYYWDRGEAVVPPIDDIELELSFYVVENLESCLDNFSAFEGRDISVGEIDYAPLRDIFETQEEDEAYAEYESIAHLQEDAVAFTLTMPVSIVEGGRKTEYSDFRASVPISITKPLFLANEFISHQKKNPDYFPIGYLASTAKLHGLEIETIYMEDDTVIVSFIDENIFAFAARYEWDT